jgi:hypothetical protein
LFFGAVVAGAKNSLSQRGKLNFAGAPPTTPSETIIRSQQLNLINFGTIRWREAIRTPQI